MAKTGCLADALGSLAKRLAKQGIDVSLVMPKYRTVSHAGEDLGELQIPIQGQIVCGRIERIVLPDTEIPVYLIVQDDYYDREYLYTEKDPETQEFRDYPDNLERYTFFCRAVLDLVKRNVVDAQIIHVNDWQTALVPVYLKTVFSRDPVLREIKTLFTFYDLSYQGCFPGSSLPVTGIGIHHFHLDELEFYGQLNLVKGGVVFADYLNTVSSTYAGEIQTEAYGFGLEGVLYRRRNRLFGISNGVEYQEWAPETDTFIPAAYSSEDFQEKKSINKEELRRVFQLRSQPGRAPLFGFVGPLDCNKGADLLLEIVPRLMDQGAQFVLLGSGAKELEEKFKDYQSRFPGQIGLKTLFNNALAHLIEAGSDLFLMPSRYEPCGLHHVVSLRYGTIPVVHHTGCLGDTIKDIDENSEGNGFSFPRDHVEELWDACQRAIAVYEQEERWTGLIRRVMREDYSWESVDSVQKYIQLYETMLED